MHPIDRLPEPLRHVVLDRQGLVARRELLDAGLTRAQVRTLTSACARPLPGVLDLTAPASDDARRRPCPDLLRRLWLAHLHAGPDSVVAREAALWLHGAELRLPDELHLVVPPDCRVQAPPGVTHVRTTRETETTTRRGLPVLTVCDAAVDLARTPRAAVHWVTLVCQQRLTTPDAIAARLRRWHRHPCREVLEGLLDDVRAGATSALEHRFRRDVLRAHDLPLGTAQLRVPGTGRRADVGYEQERLLVELDSAAFHSGPARFADLRRDEVHLASGWATLRIGWAQVAASACETAASLRDVLEARGGRPTFARCPRCP